jgi:deoxyribonuclease (pyrimidine dimer)
MTRINLIPVEELSNQHLLSEAREIKRIPNAILKGKFNLDNIPENYTMGTGHVKYFYKRLGWLIQRYWSLYQECNRRGFNVTYYMLSFINAAKLNTSLNNGWEPTAQDIRVNRTRLAEKIFVKDICQQKHFYKWPKQII